MAQLCTAQFIKDDGFATGLTPTVTINEALTGDLVGVFTMTESSVWNYIYYWNDGSENVVYFFKYDALDTDVINRYEGNTNKIESTVNTRVGGWAAIYNNVISKEKMKEIAEMVVEMLPEQKEIVLDTSKIEEKLVVIEDKIDLRDIEIDYDIILSSQDKNTQKIIKKVEWIRIPKQKECNHKEVIDEVKKVGVKIDKIEMEDIKEMKEQTNKIKTKKEQMQEENYDSIAEKIEKGIEMELEEAIPEIVMESIMEDDDFNSMIDEWKL